MDACGISLWEQASPQERGRGRNLSQVNVGWGKSSFRDSLILGRHRLHLVAPM